MYRRGAEVDLRYGLRVLEGISNHRRSRRVLRPVQEQCQQCIVSQTYPSARKTEEKSILQLRLLPDSHTKVLAQVIAYTSYFTQQRSHSFRGGFKPYKYCGESPFTGGTVRVWDSNPICGLTLRRSDLLSYPLIWGVSAPLRFSIKWLI